MVRTTAFSSNRFGVRVSFVPNIFTIYPEHFLMPEISETLLKGSFMKFFGTVRQKIFDGKSWYPPLIQTFSIPEIIATVKDSPLRKFSALWEKIFDRKSWNSPPPPLLSIKFIATGNFLKHSTEGFTYQFFRHCETIKIRQKIVR